MTLVCLLDSDNNAPRAFYISRRFPKRGCYIKFSTTEDWFRQLHRVEIAELYWKVWELQGDEKIASIPPVTKRYSRFRNPQIVSKRTA